MYAHRLWQFLVCPAKVSWFCSQLGFQWGGGVGAAAGLFTEGALTPDQIAILMPAIFLMGAQAQYMGRCLGTAGVQGRFYAPLLLIAIVNALLAMLVMRFLV